MALLEGFSQGLFAVLSWPAFGLLVVGMLIGVIFGAIPGLNATLAIILLLPFIWGMQPLVALVLLISITTAVNTGNTIPAVLFNVPGTPSASASILDGYPMAKNGQAARALSAAYTASAIGGIFGALVLLLFIPVLKSLVLLFMSPERFMMILWGILLIGVLSGTEKTKGLLAGFVGLLISLIGMDPQSGTPRYTFGQTYLLEGLPLVPLLMGLFTLPEVIELTTRGQIAKIKLEIGSEFWGGIRDAFRHWGLVLRSSFLGVVIGAIPGLGATAAAFYAYGHAVQSSKNKASFGKGNVEGVIAPESANNSVTGGELIPTLAFGVPGSANMAVLLAAFYILGILPGKSMLTDNLWLTFSFVWVIVITNLLATLLCLASTKVIARIATIPGHNLIPFILLFVIWGSFMAQAIPMDMITAFAFGILGYAMMRLEWPRVPVLIGFVLGNIAENSLYLSVASYGLSFLLRPVTLILMVLTLISVVWVWRSSKKGQGSE